MNTFGRIFRIHIFGESHGNSVGIIVDNCPPGIKCTVKDFETELARRRSGAKGTTQRKEPDIPEIQSGIYQDKTTGSPITIIFKNKTQRSSDYNFIETPRPGHADFTAAKKFEQFNDDRGGGHFSGRITVGLVAAGVIAKKIIPKINISAKLIQAGNNSNIEKAIEQAIINKNSIGGIIECKINNVPVGFGEPFFDSIESLISHAIFAIPGIRGIEFGSGFKSAQMTGSDHNDVFIDNTGRTKTNNAGGINGGISNGNEIVFRVAVKPTPSICTPQKTYNFKTKKQENLIITGRHDVCFALRVPVIVEAISSIVLADLNLN